MITLGKENGAFLLRRNCLDTTDEAACSGPARVLIAADDSRTLQSLESSIDSWGYETMVVFNDRDLMHRMEREACPPLVILDGGVQETDSLAVCRSIRLSSPAARPYIVLLTSGRANGGLPDPSSGPDDILMKPFTERELRARISTGMRIIGLETELAELVVDLKRAANKIEKLSGLLPICSHCKKIRDDSGYWNEVEKYISDHSDAEFSHAICPGCLHQYYPDVKDECL